MSTKQSEVKMVIIVSYFIEVIIMFFEKIEVTLLLVLIYSTNGYQLQNAQITEGTIFCSSTINGTTDSPRAVNYHQFRNNFSAIYVSLDSCGSNMNIEISVYNSDWERIVFCVDCGCNERNLSLPQKLYEEIYYIGIGGKSREHGKYQLTIHCDLNNSFTNFHPQCEIVNDKYICTCSQNECYEETIQCLDNMDCHLICNGTNSCFNSAIMWPIHYQGTIECFGTYSCGYLAFPQPVQNADYALECNDQWECRGSHIYCPQYADCIIICSASISCYFAFIYWSSELVKSTIRCADSTCAFYSPPPSTYLYHFNDSYNLSNTQFQILSETLQITESFQISFSLNIYAKTDGSIISITNQQYIIFQLLLNTDTKSIQMDFNNEKK
eukprot:464164_1